MIQDTCHRLAGLAVCVSLVTAATACNDDAGEDATAATSVATDAGAATSPAPGSTARPATTQVPVTSTRPPTSVSPSTTPPIDDGWAEDAALVCLAYASALPSVRPPEAVGWVEFVASWRDLRDRLPSFAAIELPDELQTPPFDVPAAMQEADRQLAAAERATTDGDDASADVSLSRYMSLLEHAAALVTVAGAECPPADPARAANADLNVPVPGVHQASIGFGSVWASPQASGTSITRVDPTDGAVVATIDVGDAPFRGQPADGRMIFRTTDAFIAIDPTSNTVVATLAKSDVGPQANRQWAVDGALWICDGQRLHRYDPSTLTATGIVIELGIDCGAVVASDELVVAWTYNEEPGESGDSTAVFIDPVTDELLATTPLPADATFPLILDDAVFFPANLGTTNAVVDRGTWTVTATPDYGREIGYGPASDGRDVYVIADDTDVLVLDADTYELTDVIEPLRVYDHLNAVAVSPGALWVATGDAGILQRFDIP